MQMVVDIKTSQESTFTPTFVQFVLHSTKAHTRMTSYKVEVNALMKLELFLNIILDPIKHLLGQILECTLCKDCSHFIGTLLFLVLIWSMIMTEI